MKIKKYSPKNINIPKLLQKFEILKDTNKPNDFFDDLSYQIHPQQSWNLIQRYEIFSQKFPKFNKNFVILINLKMIIPQNILDLNNPKKTKLFIKCAFEVFLEYTKINPETLFASLCFLKNIKIPTIHFIWSPYDPKTQKWIGNKQLNQIFFQNLHPTIENLLNEKLEKNNLPKIKLLKEKEL